MKTQNHLDALFPLSMLLDLTRELALVGHDARFIPVGDGHRAIALKVYGIRPGGRAAEIGLHSGDAIVAVNDHFVVEEVRGIIETLYREPELLIQVKRDGERRMLRWKSAPQ